jgi:ABC-2 type transport system ATP-binding protein
MKQKLAIARGLLSEPKVLLIDEPTKSLDPVSALAIRSLLREEVSRTGKTAILATHNMAEAEDLCDRIAIMDRGRAVAQGSVDDMRSILQRQEVCRLEVKGLSDTVLRSLSALDGVLEYTRTSQFDGISTLTVKLASRERVLPEVLRHIVFLGGEIHACVMRELPLEDIFMGVVAKQGQDDEQQETVA